MMTFSTSFKLSACALAASVLISACGGGAESTDKEPPTVAITAAAGASGTAVFTFTFSEDVGNSFVVEDIAVTGGTAGALVKVDATHYTMTVTGSNGAAGTIAVSVAAAKFKDVALNDNALAAEASHTFGITSLATFDETVAPAINAFGGTVISLEAGPTGGSGKALKIVRNGGEPWAGAWVAIPAIPSTAGTKTITARVYSPAAGIPMVAKAEYAENAGSGDTQPTTPVVQGWQTLTWNFTNLDASKVYNRFVLIPNLGSVDTNKTYFLDDITLLAASSGGSVTPAAEMGAGGLQTLTVATGDVKTGDGGNTMFVAGEGLFAVNYVGSAETQPPFNLAAWPGAKTANFGSITGVAGGSIGYFQDDVNLSNSSQKVDELGWVAGTALAANAVPSFFRVFVLKGPVSNNAYMGLYANAPNNGTVNTNSFSKIKFKVFGPGPMYERANLNPVLEMILTGPKVAGCATGSGGTEITQTFTANLKNGAGGSYTLPFSGFTVKGLCGTDTNANAVANVRANLARVVVNVPGTSFNYTNLEGGNYATGVQLGPIGFTNN